jgi:hypothetical protein
MIGSLCAQIALLAFAAAIVAGLYAGNTPVTVLTRALVAMVVALLIGKLAGWTNRLVLHDHLRRKKLAIDQAHLDAAREAEGTEAEDDQSGTKVGTE